MTSIKNFWLNFLWSWPYNNPCTTGSPKKRIYFSEFSSVIVQSDNRGKQNFLPTKSINGLLSQRAISLAKMSWLLCQLECQDKLTKLALYHCLVNYCCVALKDSSWAEQSKESVHQSLCPSVLLWICITTLFLLITYKSFTLVTTSSLLSVIIIYFIFHCLLDICWEKDSCFLFKVSLTRT